MIGRDVETQTVCLVARHRCYLRLELLGDLPETVHCRTCGMPAVIVATARPGEPFVSVVHKSVESDG